MCPVSISAVRTARAIHWGGPQIPGWEYAEMKQSGSDPPQLTVYYDYGDGKKRTVHARDARWQSTADETARGLYTRRREMSKTWIMPKP